MQQKSSFKIKLLSVIVPAYKQEKTIIKDIKNITKALEALKIKYEIVVVVDGMEDKSFQKVSRLKSKKIKLIGYEINRGKGHAIRYGMLHAKGDVIGFIDAGMDIHPTGLKMLLSHMEWYNAEVIVGSKLHPVSKIEYPIYRTVLSWGYRLLTRTLFGFKVRDTQVGLKFLKRQVVKDVLPRLEINRYAFDIEILAIAYALGYKRIYEAPIEINFNNSSSIVSTQLWKIITFMIIDTFRVFYRVKINRYYKKKKKKMRIFNKKMLIAMNVNK